MNPRFPRGKAQTKNYFLTGGNNSPEGRGAGLKPAKMRLDKRWETGSTALLCSSLHAKPTTGWGTLSPRNRHQGRKPIWRCSPWPRYCQDWDPRGPSMVGVLEPAVFPVSQVVSEAQHRPVPTCPSCLRVLLWLSAPPGPPPHHQDPAALACRALLCAAQG